MPVWRVRVELRRGDESIWVTHFFVHESTAKRMFKQAEAWHCDGGWWVRERTLNKRRDDGSWT